MRICILYSEYQSESYVLVSERIDTVAKLATRIGYKPMHAKHNIYHSINHREKPQETALVQCSLNWDDFH